MTTRFLANVGSKHEQGSPGRVIHTSLLMGTAPRWLQIGKPSKAGLMQRIDVLMAALNVVRLLLIKDQETNVSLLWRAAR
jgi:hypothetical protein